MSRVWWLALLAACEGQGPDDTAPAVPSTLESLDEARLFRRASLDLRGVLPSVEELDQIKSSPESLDTLLDDLLEDERFEERLVDLLHERWQTRLDEFETRYYDFGLDPSMDYAFDRSVGDEPLRLMARIIKEDRPYSEIVTAETTMSNEVLGEVFPVDYPEGATGWVETTYTDARPAAGVLATNGLWWRYVTSASNKNRARVAAISALLLCEDLLSRPVSFTGSVGLDIDPEGAITTVDGCRSCHSSIEPIASALFGFYWYTQYNSHEMVTYHAERERWGEEVLGVAPSWYGEPIEGLVDLGRVISEDPRFARCAAQSATEMLWKRDTERDDFGTVEELRQLYLEEDERLKPVLRAVLDTPEYRAGGHLADSSETLVERERTVRTMTPLMLGDTLEDLTGFTWTWQGYEQLDNDILGYRVLGGGVDGDTMGAIQQSPGLTWALVRKQLAWSAATYAVSDLGTDPSDGLVEASATVGERAAALHWRLYAEEADETWITDIEALHEAVLADSDESTAWAAVLTVMFRDPKMLGY